MYYPYFRGKQYELISIRENARLMADNRFVPIIEPVKEPLSGLARAYSSIADVAGRSILVINPTVGDFAKKPGPISEFAATLVDNQNITIGIAATEGMTSTEVLALYDRYSDHERAIIHSGFTHGKELKVALGDRMQNCSHVFVADKCNRLYRKHFTNNNGILISDGFTQQKNRDYPALEGFSDLHVTFREEGVSAFGDYLIVGNNYLEAGGPAYAIAIHLTFIDPQQDSQMFIYHFVSDRNSSPKDPAGKFFEALEKLVKNVEEPGSHILRTSAVNEFIRLYGSGHFPGLGTVKKLSMNHHLETLASYFQGQAGEQQ